MMITRKDTEFPVEGGIYLRDCLSMSEGNEEKSPTISMARADAAHWARPRQAGGGCHVELAGRRGEDRTRSMDSPR